MDREKSTQNVKDPRIEKDTLCAIIAAMEVVGGLFVIGVFFYYYGARIPNYWLALVLTPGIWGIYAGSLLWMGRPKGLNHSLALQAIQILTLEGPAIGWTVYLGLKVGIGWLNPGKILDLGIGGSVFVHYNNEALAFGAAINLVAVAAFVYLLKFKKKLQHQEELKEEYEKPAAEGEG